jgi:hypothetical protein
MRIAGTLAATSLLALTVGCLQSVDYVDDSIQGFEVDRVDNYGDEYVDIGSQIRDPRLSGQFGPGDTFQNATANASGYDDGYNSNVMLETSQNGRLGMIILDTWQGSLTTMPAGSYRSRANSMDNLVNATICGTAYDAPADDATIVIEDMPNGDRVIQVRAETSPDTGMDNRSNPAIAQFTITP